MAPSKKTEIKRMMRAQERPAIDLVFVLQDVEDPVNVGSAFRIADALKVSEIVLTGISAKPPHTLISKVGSAKYQRGKWRYVPKVEDALLELKERGYELSAVEITPTAEAYDTVPYPAKTALVVGHEDHGVTRRALEHVHRTVFIPMFGKGASLNVHVALGVVSFHVLHHGRHHQEAAGPDAP